MSEEIENIEIRYKKLKEQKESLEKEIERLNKSFTKKIDTLTRDNESLQDKISNISLNHESEKVLLSNGINDESVIDYVKFQYKSFEPGEGEEKNFESFFNHFKESKPSILKPFLQSEAESKQEAEPVQERKLRPEVPKTDSSFMNKIPDSNVQQQRISPKDFTKLSPEEQDKIFAQMGLGRR